MIVIDKVEFGNQLKVKVEAEVRSFRERYIYNAFPRSFLEEYTSELNSKMNSSHSKNDETQTQIFERSALIYNADVRLEFSEAVERYLHSLENEILYDQDKVIKLTSLYFVRKVIEFELEDIVNGSFTVEKAFVRPKPLNHIEIKLSEVNKGTRLKDILKNTADYEILIDLLISEKMCDRETHFWTFQQKGRKQKLCALLLALNSKNYYNPEKLTTYYKTLQDIAKNNFGISVSQRTFHFKHVNELKKTFDFIPISKVYM